MTRANDEHADAFRAAADVARVADARAACADLADSILTMIRAARASGASVPEAIAVAVAFVQGAFGAMRDDADGA